MKTKHIFGVKPYIVLTMLIAIVLPLTSNAAAGRVEFAIGGVTAINKEGASRSLSKGADIDSGDTIRTADGRVQVRFTDGGYMSLQPNTEFIVERYSYEGKQDGSERGFFRLVEGGLRAITGVVGRNNKPAYRVATPVATIGIRGSEFLAEHRGSRLKVRVIDGSIYLENAQGDLILFKGQSAEAGEGEKPGYSEEESGVQARGPQGGGPETGQNDYQQERQVASIFTVNEQYGEDGTSCAITNTCSTDASAVLANYAAANAIGFYSLNSSMSSISGLTISNVSVEKFGSLFVSFGDYSFSNFFDFDINQTVNGQTSTLAFYGSVGEGIISPSGGLVYQSLVNDINEGGGYFDGENFIETPAICDGTACSLAGSGLLTGAFAERGTIDFQINGVNRFYSSSGALGATAIYDAEGIIADGGQGEVLFGSGFSSEK